MYLLKAFILISLLTLSYSRTAQEWQDRLIYQILTDRFARTDGSITPCNDLTKYCGGTFKGIQNNLDYIQGMGFNAIWISPVQLNIKDGYHGYWYKDFYKISEEFGGEQAFRELIEACHERDIWIMVDVVMNHVGYVQDNFEDVATNDYSQTVPFNDPKYFNPSFMECHDVERDLPGNQTALEKCWLNWLPDLDQDNPLVRKMLFEWTSWFVKTYEIDGLRLDALRHVPIDFWQELQQVAGCYCVGEAFDFDVAYNAQYQKVISSLFNFPLNARLYKSYIEYGSMESIAKYYEEAYKHWTDIKVVANFVDNHDIPRFLNHRDDFPALKAVTAFTMTSVGIPVFYYGDEQAFNGGADPLNREPLWISNMNTESEMYQFLKVLNTFRQKTRFYELDQVQREYDDNFYSFTRGEFFFAFTNLDEEVIRSVKNHPYRDGTKVCNLFDEKECYDVEGGSFKLTILGKNVKILIPMNAEKEKKSAGNVWEQLKLLIANAVKLSYSGTMEF